MKIKDALQRIKWRFTNGKFEPNQNDIDALVFLADWINREKEKTIKENVLFAKLYIYCLTNEVEFYKDLNFANKSIHDVLKKPIDYFYDKFQKQLNATELLNFNKSVGISNLHPALLNENQIYEKEKLIFENKDELQKYVLGFWSSEETYSNLNNQLTEAINKYKNLP